MTSNTESNTSEATERELTESELEKIRGGTGRSAPTSPPQTNYNSNSRYDTEQGQQAIARRQAARDRLS